MYGSHYLSGAQTFTTTSLLGNALTLELDLYSFLSNKRRLANKRMVWKKCQNLINEGSGTNEGPEIFVTLYKEVFENSHFFDFHPIFQ